MLPLNIDASTRKQFHRALRESHVVVPTVQVLSLDHKRIADVSHMLIEGQVNVVNDSTTTRNCSLSLYDPRGHIGFGDYDPSEGALYLDNMIRVVLSYTWDGFDDWVDVPVFCGPVTSLSRDADTLAVECQGKEHLARRAVWEPKSFQAPRYVVDLIRNIMRRSGETRFDIPSSKDIKKVTLDQFDLYRQSSPWAKAQNLAHAIDRQLFYDGRGILRLRKLPKRPVWTFTDGDRGTLTSRPRVSFDVENAKNLVWVKGRKPKGANERVNGWARLPHDNPLSVQKLGRGPDNLGGVLLEVVENDNLKTKAECEKRAVELVNRRARQAVNVEFDSLPIPHLEPGDLVAVDSSDLQQEFVLRQFSIPLVAGDSMSVGYTRRMLVGRKAKFNPLFKSVIVDGWVRL